MTSGLDRMKAGNADFVADTLRRRAIEAHTSRLKLVRLRMSENAVGG